MPPLFLRTETIAAKQLIGHRCTMSLAANTTPKLWRGFMQQRAMLPPPVGGVRYSLQIYPVDYFADFRPERTFEKWAALEATVSHRLSSDFEIFTLQSGLYAVFLHQGPASEGPAAFRYIFGTWLPNSGYVLDDRPHFEVLGAKYQNEAPDSEEEIWIPIKPIA
ncbi:MAG: GyrI-like domain-containing protein [Janthinobacterium lividum]